MKSLKEEVLELIKASEEPMTVMDVQDLIGREDSTIDKCRWACKCLLKDGSIFKTKGRSEKGRSIFTYSAKKVNCESGETPYVSKAIVDIHQAFFLANKANRVPL